MKVKHDAFLVTALVASEVVCPLHLTE